MSLKLVNLSKRHKDKWILRDISLEVARGSIFGIFGPTGSGKTALLDVLLGTSQSNGGAIFFNETNITKAGREARGFQAPEPADGSIWKRIFTDSRSVAKGDRIAASLLHAISSAAKVLIIDDSFCGLDDWQREELIALLHDAVRERNLCVVFSSSDFENILEICDLTAVMANGEIKQIGTPQDVYLKPESRLVAEVTGRNNLFEARRLTSSKAEVPEFQTRTGGHRLFAQRIERGALGALNQNVTLSIRPEHISISFGASFPEDNLLKATISGVRFLGASTLINLDAGGLKLQATVLRLVGLNIGDECMVGLPPDRILIFKD